MELRFRPDDVYCKPTCGDRHNTNGFLLRVRIKKGKSAKEPKGKLNDTSNMNLNDQTSGNASDSSKKAQEEQLVTELVDQVQSCSVSTSDDTHSSHKDLSSKAETESKDSQNVLLDTSDISSPKTKENIMPTFDRNKYQNLSEDKDYELPELKVLGKVDTEFRFTSTWY